MDTAATVESRAIPEHLDIQGHPEVRVRAEHQESPDFQEYLVSAVSPEKVASPALAAKVVHRAILELLELAEHPVPLDSADIQATRDFLVLAVLPVLVVLPVILAIAGHLGLVVILVSPACLGPAVHQVIPARAGRPELAGYLVYQASVERQATSGRAALQEPVARQAIPARAAIQVSAVIAGYQEPAVQAELPGNQELLVPAANPGYQDLAGHRDSPGPAGYPEPRDIQGLVVHLEQAVPPVYLEKAERQGSAVPVVLPVQVDLAAILGHPGSLA